MKRRSDVDAHERQLWSPPEATRQIRAMSRRADLDFIHTEHSRERLLERDLIISDVIYVCQNGTVGDPAEDASISGLFKYQIECTTPNSNGRSVRLVVIPDLREPAIKAVTVMWVDGT